MSSKKTPHCSGPSAMGRAGYCRAGGAVAAAQRAEHKECSAVFFHRLCFSTGKTQPVETATGCVFRQAVFSTGCVFNEVFNAPSTRSVTAQRHEAPLRFQLRNLLHAGEHSCGYAHAAVCTSPGRCSSTCCDTARRTPMMISSEDSTTIIHASGS